LRAVSDNAGADLIEHVDRQAVDIRRRLEHERWDGANQHHLGHALGTVARHVARDFPPPVERPTWIASSRSSF